MGSKFYHFLFAILAIQTAYAQIPNVCSGKLIRFPQFKSVYVDARNIDVWLPLNTNLDDSVDVLYMHDGQMLFDSNTTWNKQEWGVDETMTRLLAEGKIRNCLVVGIWNTPKRRQEYFPQEVFNQIPLPLKDSITKDIGGIPFSDLYLKFIVEELKPFIDSAFHVKRNKEHTFIAGASMGGLISFYAVCKYPEVFGGAACLSTHWPGSVKRNEPDIPKAFAEYAQKHLPSAQSHLFYFDYGTATLDAWYEPGQLLMNKEMQRAGYSNKNWLTQKYEGANHSENAWKQRLHVPLVFLLSK